MEVRILDERPNPLLHRIEYRFAVTHPTAATPSRDQVRGELAKLVKVPKERLVIERMRAKFGTAESVGEAAAYQTKEFLEVVVREHILVRNGLREKAIKIPPGGAPAEPAAPAAPAPTAPETPKEST